MNELQMRTFLVLALCGSWSNGTYAVELWYDFESDTGSVATDKLIADGMQNGDLQGYISFLTGGSVPHGAQAAKFDPPTLFNPPYSTIEIPGSSALGDTFTLALHANVENASTFRLFSNFLGSGGVGADRVLFDFVPSLGMRAFVGGTSVSESIVPTYPTAGYHHYALTVDSGVATLYFDGAEVGGGLVPTGNLLAANLRIGEDLGGTPNEQLLGNVDDVLVIDQALSPAIIAQLAAGTSALTAVSPAGAYAVNYNFENGYHDAFAADGNQAAIPSFAGTPIDSNPANAKEGLASVRFDNLSTLFDRFSKIETPITGTDLGDQFTLSGVVNVSEGGFTSGGLIRLFSTYAGSGSAANALILDFNPDADVSGIGIRLVLPGKGSTTFPGTFSYNEDHTITAVYNNGDIRLYLDGEEVKANSVAGGPINLGAFLLQIGEDRAGAVNENFVGVMDDVLILQRALNGQQVRYLARNGAEAFFAVPEPSSISLLVVGGVALIFGADRKRRRNRRGHTIL